MTCVKWDVEGICAWLGKVDVFVYGLTKTLGFLIKDWYNSNENL